MFITEEIVKDNADESNLYAMRTDGKELGKTLSGIEQSIRILLFTGIYLCLSYRMYQESSSRFPALANGMTRKEFENLLRCAHCNNNKKMKARL